LAGRRLRLSGGSWPCRSATLATFDRKLADAARDADVRVFGDAG
jgi:hypothetical protein